MAENKVLSEFKKQLLIFFDELIETFPREGDLVIMRLFLANQIPIKDAMDLFNHKINKNDKELKKMVENRDEVFFLEHNLFDSLGKDKVTHFKRLWRSGRLNEEEKDKIWEWIDAFIWLGDCYTKIVSKQQ